MKKIGVVLLMLFLISCSTQVEIGETTGSPIEKITYTKYTPAHQLFSFQAPQYWKDTSSQEYVELRGPSKEGVYYTITAQILAPKELGGYYSTKEQLLEDLTSQWAQTASYKQHNLEVFENALEVHASYTFEDNKFTTKQVIFTSPKGYLIRLGYTGPASAFAAYLPAYEKAKETFNLISQEI